jgi:hypothetical protein
MEAAETSARIEIPCRHLRNKEMYYDAPDDDAYASGLWWCTKTHEAYGPDGQSVGKKECCEGRQCYLR